MKKIALVTVLALGVMLFSALASEAGIWWGYYPGVPGYNNADDSRVVDRFSWFSPFGFFDTHLAQTFNNAMVTTSAVEMNPDGIPLVYYWADVYTSYYDLYYSVDGVYFYHYGTYVY
jgi:hypothetical protein